MTGPFIGKQSGRRDDITDGMLVRSRDGHRLGMVIQCNPDSFQVEKGIFFPEEYLASYADVFDVTEGEIHLKHDAESLRPMNPLGWEATGLPSSEAELEPEPDSEAA